MERKASKVVGLMNAANFEKEVRDRSQFTHMVFITDHVLLDNADRKITRPMILRALRKGTVASDPHWNSDHANWTGKMSYIGTGMELTVVCAIKDDVLIVTVVTAYGTPR